MKRHWWWIGPLVGCVIGVVGTILTMASGIVDVPTPPNMTWGSFIKNPVVTLDPNGRDLILMEDFVYLDPRGKAWIAPTGSRVDGASIPREFWSLTGGPLEGKFRNASIIHDVGCQAMAESWEDVHRIFYEACRCGGVDEKQAMTLYAAVYQFGPRWTTRQVMLAVTDTAGNVTEDRLPKKIIEREEMPVAPAGSAERLSEFVRNRKFTLEDVHRLDHDDSPFTGSPLPK